MSKLEKLLAEKQEIDAEEGIVCEGLLLKIKKAAADRINPSYHRLQGAAARSQAYQGLNLDGASIDDLALDFTLPGYADVPLKVSFKTISSSLIRDFHANENRNYRKTDRT
jgi:hypothetical protein